ncbi:class I SAM-dependent methyltransferase [Aspergillus tanneri]|uniref:Methyltransferase domain-containing protein n=1 Tax=Aspergillus tanneri TaxID=1220188 RepID=A0A5M9MMB2_9EURO|nr:uncharacterized protein ATNIH1004_007549 [Aspergillus tanneri]KAA8646123.1 hypothetical protein ATNIH1004_007549 [Aspergillus tanneri]
MSASRVGRAALKKAKMPIAASPKTGGGKIPVEGPGKKTPVAPSLPKRANPHLTNLQMDQARMSPKVMTVLGVSVLAMSTYCGYLYATYKREVAQAQSLDIPRDVSDRYNRTAGTFDADVELSEKLMWLGSKRKDLVRRARGDVLEVSCGTGRNLEYYDLGERRGLDKQGHVGVRGCRSVTFIDLSPQMVEITRNKFTKIHPVFQNVVFRTQDAADVVPPSTGAHPAYYDTVIQTMGLCSMPDPVRTLRHLGTITEPQRGGDLAIGTRSITL